MGYSLLLFFPQLADSRGGQWCNRHNKCVHKLDTGEKCDSDSQCQSSYCNHWEHPSRCRSKLSVGDHCEDNDQCSSNWCIHHECREKYGLGHKCDYDWECRSKACDNDDDHCGFFDWKCPSDTCVPIMGATGGYCTQDYQCKSDRCHHHECERNNHHRRGFE